MFFSSRLLLAKLVSSSAKAVTQRPRHKKLGAILQISNTISIPFIPGMESLRTYEKAKEQDDIAKKELAAAGNMKNGRGKRNASVAGRTVRAAKSVLKGAKNKANTGSGGRPKGSPTTRSGKPRRK